MFGLLLLLSLSVILGIFIPKVNYKQRNKKIYLSIIFCLLFLYSGLRGSNVGIDTCNYLLRFYQIKDYGLIVSFSNIRLEKGYILLNYILGFIFDNAQIVLIVSSLFICYVFAIYIYRYSTNVVISTFLYIIFIFSSSMNIMRQFLAFSIIILSFKYIIEKKVFKAGAFMIISSLFHSTATLFLPLLILAIPKIKINKKCIVMSGIIAVFSIVMFNIILEKFFIMFPVYERFMSSSKYTAESELSMFWVIFYISVILCSILLLSREKYKTFFYNKDSMLKENKTGITQEALVLFTIILITHVVCLFVSSKLWIATRIMAYTKPSICIMLPVILDGILPKKSFIKHSVLLIFFISFSIWGYFMFLTDPHRLLPYTFFWN